MLTIDDYNIRKDVCVFIVLFFHLKCKFGIIKNIGEINYI